MVYDYLLVGGGLANGLVALTLLARRPRASLALVEKESRPCGNHTWSFHQGDLTPPFRETIDDVLSARWPAYLVRFPNLVRSIPREYAAIHSCRMAEVLRDRMASSAAADLVLGVEVVDVGPRAVRLADGRRLEGRVVLDGRGPEDGARRRRPLGEGYQKFLGLEVLLDRPVAPLLPRIMDATVEQLDGYRFVYVLPFARERMLIEDTYYSDTSSFEPARLRERIHAYAAREGWPIRQVIREESGVLPIPWRGSPGRSDPVGPVRVGYRGGWFHPTTGYSVPCAGRIAEIVAETPPQALAERIETELAPTHRRQGLYFRLLNRMLFRGVRPEERWRVFERFHRLPDATIERFYAMRLTASDRARLLCGRPPRGFSVRRTLGIGGGR